MGLFSGGTSSYNSTSNAFSGLDKKALPQWNNIFSGLQDGIAPWQQAGFNQAIQAAMSHFSGANAAKGGLTPGMLPQIASSAAQYATPQFSLANTDMLGNLLNLRNISTSNSTSSGFQRGPNMFGSALAGAMQNAMSPSTYLGGGGVSGPARGAMF